MCVAWHFQINTGSSVGQKKIGFEMISVSETPGICAANLF